MLQVQTAVSEDEGNDRTWKQRHQRAAAAFAKVEAEAENSHLLLRLGGGGSFFSSTYFLSTILHLSNFSSTHFCSSSSSISIFVHFHFPQVGSESPQDLLEDTLNAWTGRIEGVVGQEVNPDPNMFWISFVFPREQRCLRSLCEQRYLCSLCGIVYYTHWP